jgi:hypothetical protein
MPSHHTGSCQCGAVRFEITGDFEHFFLCHCGRCRKDTGSAHAANLFSSQANLTWLSGEKLVKTYRVPGSRHEKSFCTECGAAMPRQQTEGAMLVVPAGSLDTPVNRRPTAHIAMADSADWDNGLETVRKLEGMPG